MPNGTADPISTSRCFPEEDDGDFLGPARRRRRTLTRRTERSGAVLGPVLVFNVAVAALAIGLMMIAFQGWWDRGLQVTLVGVLAMAYGLFRYYRFREERDGDE